MSRPSTAGSSSRPAPLRRSPRASSAPCARATRGRGPHRRPDRLIREAGAARRFGAVLSPPTASDVGHNGAGRAFGTLGRLAERSRVGRAPAHRVAAQPRSRRDTRVSGGQRRRPARHDALARATHGHPLALSLCTDVILRGGEADVDPMAPDVVGTLVRRAISPSASSRDRRVSAAPSRDARASITSRSVSLTRAAVTTAPGGTASPTHLTS